MNKEELPKEDFIKRSGRRSGESLARSFPEDLELENGNYTCHCSECQHLFQGHKRRTVCKQCSTPESSKPIAKTPTYSELTITKVVFTSQDQTKGMDTFDKLRVNKNYIVLLSNLLELLIKHDMELEYAYNSLVKEIFHQCEEQQRQDYHLDAVRALINTQFYEAIKPYKSFQEWYSFHTPKRLSDNAYHQQLSKIASIAAVLRVEREIGVKLFNTGYTNRPEQRPSGIAGFFGRRRNKSKED